MAVDPSKAYAGRKKRDKSAAGADKVVAKSRIHPEVMVLDSAKDRLSQNAEVNLMVTAKESFAVQIGSPAHPRSQKIGVNLVMARGIKNAKQVRGFDGEIETR